MYFVGGFGNASTAPTLLVDPDDRMPATPEFRIPANVAAHHEYMHIPVTLPYNLKEVKLYSADPHMHLAGTELTATVARPGEPAPECLTNVAWNFDWQRSYVYRAPLDQLPTLRPGDVIDVTCTWNNTLANPFVQRALADAGRSLPVDISLGQGTLDEMCLTIFGYAIPL